MTFIQKHFRTVDAAPCTAAGAYWVNVKLTRMAVSSIGTASVGGIRSVARIVRGTSTSEGAGVMVTRTLGTPMLPQGVDPFLMLDELKLPEQAAAAGVHRRRVRACLCCCLPACVCGHVAPMQATCMSCCSTNRRISRSPTPWLSNLQHYAGRVHAAPRLGWQ